MPCARLYHKALTKKVVEAVLPDAREEKEQLRQHSTEMRNRQDLGINRLAAVSPAGFLASVDLHAQPTSP